MEKETEPSLWMILLFFFLQITCAYLFLKGEGIACQWYFCRKKQGEKLQLISFPDSLHNSYAEFSREDYLPEWLLQVF